MCVVKEKLTNVQIVEPENTGHGQTGILPIPDGSFGPLYSISLLETTEKTGNLRKTNDRVGAGTVQCSQVSLYNYMYVHKYLPQMQQYM